MKRRIDVHGSEVMAGQGEVVLKSETNRECLVIAAHDSIKKVGGLAHAMFLSFGLDKIITSSTMLSASSAIDEMIKDMVLLGSKKENIEICLVAGENTHNQSDDPTYNQNITSTIDLLKKRHIKVKKGTTGKAGNFHVSLDVASGDVMYS